MAGSASVSHHEDKKKVVVGEGQKKRLHPKGELLLTQARSIYEQPFKSSRPVSKEPQAIVDPVEHEVASISNRKIIHTSDGDKYEDENRPSTYYSVANSGARHCPLTYSSRTLIGNWQENRYLEDLPRNKVVTSTEYFTNVKTANDYRKSLKAYNQSSSLQYVNTQ